MVQKIYLFYNKSNKFSKIIIDKEHTNFSYELNPNLAWVVLELLFYVQFEF